MTAPRFRISQGVLAALVVAFVLYGVLPAAAQHWTKVGENSGQSFFVDEDSARVLPSGRIEWWSKVEYFPEKSVGMDRVSYTLHKMLYDPDTQMFTFVSPIDYTRTGTISGEHRPTDRWGTVPPGSIIESAVQSATACARRKQ